jgi:hypothetical protein
VVHSSFITSIPTTSTLAPSKISNIFTKATN